MACNWSHGSIHEAFPIDLVLGVTHVQNYTNMPYETLLLPQGDYLHYTKLAFEQTNRCDDDRTAVLDVILTPGLIVEGSGVEAVVVLVGISVYHIRVCLINCACA
jgi:hypothetical protein